MLNEEQLEEIRAFFHSPTCGALLEQLQANLVADWMNGKDPADRERCWQELQAILRLVGMLRDATAMKRLTQRAQERRVYTA